MSDKEKTEKEEELSESLSDDEPQVDEQDKRRDMEDLFTNKPRLKKNDSDSSDYTDDMEYESNDRKKPKEEIVEDDFLVDDDGNSVKRRKITLSVTANATTGLNGEHIETATNLFAADVEVPEAPQPKLPELETDNVADTVLDGEDFERECDRGIIDPDISDDLINEEANWIYGKHFSTRSSDSSDIEAIFNILKELHREAKTPQFIINYRKNIYCDSFISDDDVYTIQRAIKEFRIIKEKRERIAPLLEMLDQPEENGINPEAAQKMKEFLNSAEEFELDNAYNYYQLQINPEETSVSVIFKKKKKIYNDFIYSFLYKPDEFALKLATHDATLSDPPEPTISGISDVETSMKQHEAILDYFYNNQYKDAYIAAGITQPPPIEDMEEDMKAFAAQSFGIHPLIISEVRRIFGDIVINTLPTERGMDNPLLYPMGIYGPVKRLTNKPVYSFTNSDQWLLIDEARKSGYLTCTIDTKNGIDSDISTIVRKFCHQYSSDWDGIRTDIITAAIHNFIWPQIISETEKGLFREASKYVCNEVEKRLFAQLTSPPYTVLSEAEPRILKTTPIICIHYSDDDRKKIYIVRVSENGTIESHKILSSTLFTASKLRVEWDSYELQMRKPNLSANEVSSIKSQVEFVDFISSNQTPVIAVTPDSLRATKLVEKITELIEQRIEGYKPVIIFAPSDAAKIYAYSRDCNDQELREKSKDSNFDQALLVAASTARRMQNPLSELTRLVTLETNHLVDWSMTPFQRKFVENTSSVSPVHEAIERACIKAVALTGVDMKLVLQSAHHQSTLQFVPGLGPRGAAEIIKRSKKAPVAINCRDNFIKHADIFRNDVKIYSYNSLPFIRFPVEKKESENDQRLFLDGTLIPPEYYSESIDFIKRGVNETTSIDVSDLIKFFEDPNRTKNKDDSIERYMAVSRFENKPLIEFIADQLIQGPYERLRYPQVEREQAQPAITELKNPLKRFQDDRFKIYQTMPNNYYRVMSDKELFDAFTVSSPENITVNTITTVTIKNINSRQIFAEHSSGIDAVTPNVEEQVASLLARENAPQDRDGLKGTPQDCVIKEIILPLLQIVVSYNAEDIKGARDYNIILEDNTYFDILGEVAAIREKEEKSKNVFCRYARRAIQHKDFRDITAAQAESELQTKQIGAAIFRPSSKGNEHLSLTIHFPNNKFAHYDIVERNKRNPDALGDELWIRDMSFSDLEEIKWTFVKGIADNLKKIINNPKWVEDPDTCEEIIKEEKEKNPQMLVYRVTSSEYNGHLDLVWQTEMGQGKMVHEPLRLACEKIYYRDTEYYDIRKVFEYLKKVGISRPPNTKPKPIVTMKTESEEIAEKRKNSRAFHQANQFGRN